MLVFGWNCEIVSEFIEKMGRTQTSSPSTNLRLSFSAMNLATDVLPDAVGPETKRIHRWPFGTGFDSGFLRSLIL